MADSKSTACGRLHSSPSKRNIANAKESNADAKTPKREPSSPNSSMPATTIFSDCKAQIASFHCEELARMVISITSIVYPFSNQSES